MANIYVRSTDGDDADNGSTWALAKATLAGADAIAVAGDTVWVSQVHAESSASTLSFNWDGTLASPIRILCGNDASEPPTTLASTATITTTGNSNILLSTGAGYFYMYGMAFHAGTGSSGGHIRMSYLGSAIKLYEACTFHIVSTASGQTIGASYSGALGETICTDCHFQFSHVTQTILAVENFVTIRGGSLLSGTTPTALFDMTTSGGFIVEGFDCSAVASTMNLSANSAHANRLHLRNCKLPASWSGSVNSATPGSDGIFELHNCDSSDTNYRYQRKTQFGIIDSETTVVRTGGASDGVTPLSWKMVSNTNPEWNHQTLKTSDIVRWNETTGSAITATIEFIHDSVTNMTDQQIWMELEYLGTSGFPLSVFIDDAAADYITTAADQTDSSETWTTTGLTNPNTQKLSVTFTPQEKGFLRAVVKVAMASKTVYVDPKLDVS
jgi:hypothetical protein